MESLVQANWPEGTIKRKVADFYASGMDEHAIDAADVQRYPMQLEWAVNQGFEINQYQPLLFVVDSFDHLFGLVDRLEKWMRQGKLNNTAPGEPEVNERDLKSFLHETV